MDNIFEEMREHTEEHVGCSTIGYQDVNVCVPISIKAFGEVGNAKTQCLGKSIISSGCDFCAGKPGDVCKFTISQKLRVEVPVIFGARAEAGEAIIDCVGCTEKMDCCCLDYEDDQKA